MTPSFDAVSAQLTAACAAWEGPPLSPALLPVRTVGVQGDGRSYSYLAALSMQGSADSHWPALLSLAKQIPGSVHEVRRAPPCTPAPLRTQAFLPPPFARFHSFTRLLTRVLARVLTRSTVSSSCWASRSPRRLAP